MVKLIIFDWDDVITIGSKEGYYACYGKTLKDLGLDISFTEMEKGIILKWGRTHRETLSEILKPYPELLDKACEIYEGHLFGDTFIDALSILPGTNELLSRLAKKFILGVTTGEHPKVFKEKVIPKFQIPEVFSQIIFAYDVETAKQKPDPYTVNAILEKQHILPQDAVVVGDGANDVIMAIKAQVEPIVVLTGHLNREKAESLGVKKIINSILDLEQVLI
jgi:phosphoglycolate phosphatase-like HAD superfamily hydrolase